MGKNCVQRVVVHLDEQASGLSLSDKISQFHVDIIERRLASSGLSAEDQIAVIKRIMENLNA